MHWSKAPCSLRTGRSGRPVAGVFASTSSGCTIGLKGRSLAFTSVDRSPALPRIKDARSSGRPRHTRVARSGVRSISDTTSSERGINAEIDDIAWGGLVLPGLAGLASPATASTITASCPSPRLETRASRGGRIRLPATSPPWPLCPGKGPTLHHSSSARARLPDTPGGKSFARQWRQAGVIASSVTEWLAAGVNSPTIHAPTISFPAAGGRASPFAGHPP